MIIDNIILANKQKKRESHESANSISSDSVKRSLLKTISWRVVGTLDTVLISWLITGKLDLAFSIGGIELVSKMVLYYFHERAWNRIK